MKKSALLIFAFFFAQFAITAQSNSASSVTLPATIRYRTIKVDGLDIFYREAGDKDKPVLLLLHGFPSSSQMYTDLMTDLAGDFHLIAPDYPGFGNSSAPPTTEFDYTFDHLASVITHFIDTLGLTKYSLYMQDYGGPVGFRIAAQRPQAIQALIIQNANAYSEGLGEAAGPLLAYSRNPNATTEKGARAILTFASTKWQYVDGAEDSTKINPDRYVLDQFYLDRNGNDQIQLALFRDYKNNLALYDSWHRYLRTSRPPVLILSGRNDKIFTAAGAAPFKRDVPDAQIHLLNGGHFLLAEKHLEAARLIRDFFQRS